MCGGVVSSAAREPGNGDIPGGPEPRRPVMLVGMGTASLPLAEPERRQQDRPATHPQAPRICRPAPVMVVLDTGPAPPARVTTTTPVRGMSDAEIMMRV
jgi:hypothetical protein